MKHTLEEDGLLLSLANLVLIVASAPGIVANVAGKDGPYHLQRAQSFLRKFRNSPALFTPLPQTSCSS